MSAPTFGWRACRRFEFARSLVIVLPARFEVRLPAVAADGHLHDLGRAFVNRGDANVAADFLHHVFVRVTVATQRLDAGLGGRIAGFGRHVLGDRALGVQAAFGAGVDALRGFFDVGASRFQPHHVGHDQLVGVSLLFRERRSAWMTLGGVGNCSIERGPSCAQSECCHHQARITEHGLRLIQSLAFDAADKPVGIDIDVV